MQINRERRVDGAPDQRPEDRPRIVLQAGHPSEWWGRGPLEWPRFIPSQLFAFSSVPQTMNSDLQFSLDGETANCWLRPEIAFPWS